MTGRLWIHVAAWLVGREYRLRGPDLQQPDPAPWWWKPLRPEVAFLAIAVLILAASGRWRAPRGEFPNADRVVSLQRGILFMGRPHPVIPQRLVEAARQLDCFAALGVYRLRDGSPAGAFVSPELFEVMGIKAAAGRLLREEDPARTAVLPFGAHPDVIGRRVLMDGQDYLVVGILSKQVLFSKKIGYFAPILPKYSAVGAAALLKPGVSAALAQEEFRLAASGVDPAWSREAFKAAPWVSDHRAEMVLGGAGTALVTFLAAAVFLALRTGGDWRAYAFLAARLAALIAGLTALRVASTAWGELFPGYYFVQFWFFLMACAAAAFLVVRDHIDRCPVCFMRLQMPVSFGAVGSFLVERRATEYACPQGHGLLYVSELDGQRNRWTVLDDSWKDLFARPEPRD